MAKNRLPALDGLRGLAALSVVAYHSFLRSPDFSGASATFQTDGAIAWWATLSPLRLLWDGKAAVWLFFVLSGYVLSRRYWSVRARRPGPTTCAGSSASTSPSSGRQPPQCSCSP